MTTIKNGLKNSTLLTMVLLLGICGATAAWGGTVNGCASGAAGPTPTNAVFPIDCTGASPGTLLADMVATFNYTTTAGTNSGTIESAVYSVNGTLDFYYQIYNSSTSATALARLTATNFTGFITDAGFRTDGSILGGSFADGSIAPVTADSNVDGTVIGFSFYPPTAPNPEIGPGDYSYVFVISTDATSYTAGNASIIDGGTETVAAYQPKVGAGVPEPATMSLLGLGLIGLASLRKRFR